MNDTEKQILVEFKKRPKSIIKACAKVGVSGTYYLGYTRHPDFLEKLKETKQSKNLNKKNHKRHNNEAKLRG